MLMSFTPEDLEILYKDDDLVVVNKPSRLIVHPFKKFHHDRTNLMKLLRDKVGCYVYPIHRLDRQVSGPIIFGLNSEIVNKVKENWHSEECIKMYTALCKGTLTEDGQFDFKLRHKKFKQRALTLYQILHNFEDSTLVNIQIKTGRKHQIRRHFSRRMAHLLGDKRYGYRILNEAFEENYGLTRIFLHCNQLSLPHPLKDELIDCKVPIPDELREILVKMNCPNDLLETI